MEAYQGQFISVEGYLAHAIGADKPGPVYSPETPIAPLVTNSMQGLSEWDSKYITDREPVVADIDSMSSTG